MRVLRNEPRTLLLIICAVTLAWVLPATALGQGRGRGQEKKLDRFINGHDASDGRWDGRGPDFGRRTVINNLIIPQRRVRNREFERNERIRERRLERRTRSFDNDDFLRGRRLRDGRLEMRRRHFDNDDFFRGERLRQRHRHLYRRGFWR